MTTKNPTSVAESIDRHLNLIVSGLFIFSLSYGVSAAVYLANDPWVGYLDKFSDILALVGFLTIVISVWVKFRNTTAIQRRKFLDSDSYVIQMFEKAGIKAWAITFLALTLLKMFDNFFAGMPKDFFIELISCLTVGAFCVAFFVLNRDASDDEYEQVQ